MRQLSNLNAWPGAALAVALLAAAPPAAAQQPNWRPSSGGAGQRAYIDTNSIQRDGDKVRFTREIHIGEVRQLGERGARFDRIGGLTEADCRARTIRPLTLYAKLGETLVFSTEDDSAAEPVEDGSTAASDLRAACLNQWPPQP